ncbi:MAG: flagellar filament capping protein FliD [Massilia sp.]
MPISASDLARLSTELALFQARTPTPSVNTVAPIWSSGAASGTDAASLLGLPQFGSMLDQFSAALGGSSLPTPTTPTGLDASQPFSMPGQNMVTVLNRVEYTFKAQYAELGEMHQSLTQYQHDAQKLAGLTADTPIADLKSALQQFVISYNAGVNRFAPDVTKGGILEGSWEATRARFATERDISYVLNGAEVGLKGGLEALGITTDKASGLASVNQEQLDAALARDPHAVAAALAAFGSTFVKTVDTLNGDGHAQQRQMANLDRAVHWIDDNKASVQQEFGPGAAATPDDAFSKAAKRYDEMAKLNGKA